MCAQLLVLVCGCCVVVSVGRLEGVLSVPCGGSDGSKSIARRRQKREEGFR